MINGEEGEEKYHISVQEVMLRQGGISHSCVVFFFRLNYFYHALAHRSDEFSCETQ